MSYAPAPSAVGAWPGSFVFHHGDPVPPTDPTAPGPAAGGWWARRSTIEKALLAVGALGVGAFAVLTVMQSNVERELDRSRERRRRLMAPNAPKKRKSLKRRPGVKQRRRKLWHDNVSFIGNYDVITVPVGHDPAAREGWVTMVVEITDGGARRPMLPHKYSDTRAQSLAAHDAAIERAEHLNRGR